VRSNRRERAAAGRDSKSDQGAGDEEDKAMTKADNRGWVDRHGDLEIRGSRQKKVVQGGWGGDEVISAILTGGFKPKILSGGKENWGYCRLMK